MRQQSPYIYENVMKLSQLLSEDFSKEAMKIYQDCFIKRFQQIVIDHSNNSLMNEQFSTATKKLTNLEREIFELNKR